MLHESLESHLRPSPSRTVGITLWTLAIAIIVLFAILRFVHLQADFPSGEAQSGDILTDEGWYANAAIAYLLTGHWYIPGDLNPIIATPVFPTLQILALRFLGLSLESARLTSLLFFILTMILTYFLTRSKISSRAALVVLILIATNYLLFIYSRIALLEMPMTFFILLTLALAYAQQNYRSYAIIPFLSLSFSLALLTKIFAALVMPLVFLVLLGGKDRIGKNVFKCALFGSLSGAFLLLYYILLGRPHLQDLQFYFSANVATRTQTHLFGLIRGFVKAIYYGRAMDPILYPVVALSALIFFFKVRVWRKSSLVLIAATWILIYLLLMGSQNYVPPRYYLNLIIPFAILVGFMADYQLANHPRSILTVLFCAIIGISVGLNGLKIIRYARAPEYSWINMTQDLSKVIAAEGVRKPVLLGHFANSISLATGILSCNERFATESLESRVLRCLPSHYVCLGTVKSDILSVLEKLYVISEIKKYDVYDNYYTGEPIVLYRLTKKD